MRLPRSVSRWLAVGLLVTVLSAGADALVAAPALATSAGPTVAAGPNAATGSPAPSAAASTPTSSPSPTADGSLRLVSSDPVQGDPLRFAWSTSTPAEHDWVAVYDDPAQGPTHQTHVGASTAWSYTPGEGGTVTIPSTALTAGHPITAYLLADDGYRWLAPPVTFTLAAPASGPTDDGTLRLETTGAHVGDTVRFSFSTTSPDARNWIGIYADPSTMPADGQSHGASTTWTYVPATTTGTADLSTAGLPADTRIGAVLLYADGYQRLAPPITFTLTPAAPLVGTGAPTTAHFLQDDVVEPATRAGTAIHRTVAGAWRATDGGRPTVAPTFASTAGPDWLRVAPDGTVTGTAPSSSLPHPALLTVTATAPDGVTGSVVLEFPVTDPGTPPRVKAETLEAWDGGTHVDDPVEKLARSVVADRVDLLALQDASGDEAQELATALGWDVETAPGGRAVLSAWPLQPRTGVSPRLQALSVTVDVAGTRVVVWDVDLPTSAVDPASVCTAGAARTVAAERDTDTTSAAVAIADRVRTDVRTGARVVLLGALRSPSHLDWTRADDTCGVGPVAWPVTTALAAAGLRDAYRTAEPSVAAHPGATTDVFDGRSVGATPSAARDAGVPTSTGRQDAVLVAGRIAVTEAHTAVDGFPVAGSRANRWTSDHAAVAVTLVLTEDSGAGTPATGGTGPARPGGATPVGGDDRPGAHPASDPRADPSGPLAFTGSPGLLGTALVALALLALGASALRRRRARPVTGSTDDPSDPTTRTTEQEGPR